MFVSTRLLKATRYFHVDAIRVINIARCDDTRDVCHARFFKKLADEMLLGERNAAERNAREAESAKKEGKK